MFTIKDYLKYIMKQALSCKRAYLTPKEAQFLKGQRKLEESFDLIHIFKAVRKIELFSKVILSKH